MVTNVGKILGGIVAGLVVFLPVQVDGQIPKVSNGIRLTDGALVTSSEKGVYLLEGGEKRPITSPMVFKSYGFEFADVQTIKNSDLKNIPKGNRLPLRSGAVVSPAGDPAVYIIEEGKKRYIPSPEILNLSPYSFSDVLTVKKETLENHKLGERYTDPFSVVEGTPIYAEGEGAYKYEDGQKRAIPSKLTFRSHFEWDMLEKVSSQYLSSLEKGEDIVPADRTLISGEESVYLIEDGQKRPFLSKKNFNKWGFQWSKVQEGKKVLEGLPKGRAVKARKKFTEQMLVGGSSKARLKRVRDEAQGTTEWSNRIEKSSLGRIFDFAIGKEGGVYAPFGSGQIKKLNKEGKEEWTYETARSNIDSVSQTMSTGAFVLHNDALLRLSQNGQIQWKYQAPDKYRFSRSLTKGTQSGIYLLVSVKDTNKQKILRIDSETGKVQDSIGSFENVSEIYATQKGHLYVVDNVRRSRSSLDRIHKYSQEGNLKWSYTLKESSDADDYNTENIIDVALLPSKNRVFLAKDESIVALDSKGEKVWSKDISNDFSPYGGGIAASEKGIYLASRINTGIIKLSLKGEKMWEMTNFKSGVNTVKVRQVEK